MLDLNDNEFDNAFRKKISSADLDFEEQAWLKMEHKLRKRDRIAFFRKISVVLIVLALGAGLYFIRTENSPETTRITKNKSIPEQKTSKLPETKASDTFNTDTKKQFSQSLAANPKNHDRERQIVYPDYNNVLVHPAIRIDSTEISQNLVSRNLLPLHNAPALLSNPYKSPEFFNTPLAKTSVITDSSKNKLSVKAKTFNGWELSFSTGPDFNSVSSLIGGKISNSMGLSLGLELTKRWRIQTGLRYAQKNYSASAYEYHYPNAARQSSITEIDASCNVLEIPLTASYTVFDSPKRSIDISTGLSSYLMLKEKYNFNYDPHSYYPSYTLIKNNANQHYLSVLDFSAAYNLKLRNKHINLGLEPYVKIPLQGIGEGKVNLKSSGLSLNVRYEFGKKNN